MRLLKNQCNQMAATHFNLALLVILQNFHHLTPISCRMSGRLRHGRQVFSREQHDQMSSRVNSSESLSSSWFYQQDQPAILSQCCACDEAKYELVFEGLWSKYTHPDDFPENYWLAYFSDIIGASHSNDFQMWAKDSLASEGVRELAELGSTKKLESELKQVSSKTRTIIKARELRYPTLNSKTSAVFRTDKQHHLVSILSKLGPSPDWMVGVSSLELCQLDCTWAAQRVVNLYLWDAGTDSGGTFTASDAPTQPQARIQPYQQQARHSEASSNEFANGGDSSQLGAGDGYGQLNGHSVYAGPLQQQQRRQKGSSESMLLPIVDDASSANDFAQPGAQSSASNTKQQQDQLKPFARLTVTRQRIYEKSCNGAGSSAGGFNSEQAASRPTSTYSRPSSLSQLQHQNHLHPTINSDTLIEPMNKPNYLDCRHTDWSDWSSCSSTCGKGIRTRTRAFLDDQAHLNGCPQADLIEKEICLAECVGNASCVTRDWSDWSRCSVNCGQGVRSRTRAPISQNAKQAACASIDLAEVEPCTGDSCEPNGNAYEQATASASLHCAVTDWSQWSECSVACGRGTKIRTRQFVRKEDVESCNSVKLLQKQSCNGRPELCKQVANKTSRKICMLPASKGLCSADLIRWHYDRELRRCKKFSFGGCEGNENNFRTLQECHSICVDHQHQNGNHNNHHHNHQQQQQPNRDQKQSYYDLPVIDCKLSNWSPWSTCSALCGTGRRTRSRYIIQMPQNGGKPCDKKLTRTQKCRDLPLCPQDYLANQNNSNDGGDQIGGQASKTSQHNYNNGPQETLSRGPTIPHRTTTTTATPGGSMMDDEDDSKFSRSLKAELNNLHLSSYNPSLTYVSDAISTSTEMELIGSSSFHVRNGFVYPFGYELET